MKRGRLLVLAILAVPALFVGNCFYHEINQPRELASLCKSATPGRRITEFMAEAARPPFKPRTGGPVGKNPDEWFDRQYLRTGKYLVETKKMPGDYSVVFAKPGMGYYACILVHKDGVVQSAWFEDHSS